MQSMEIVGQLGNLANDNEGCKDDVRCRDAIIYKLAGFSRSKFLAIVRVSRRRGRAPALEVGLLVFVVDVRLLVLREIVAATVGDKH